LKKALILGCISSPRVVSLFSLAIGKAGRSEEATAGGGSRTASEAAVGALLRDDGRMDGGDEWKRPRTEGIGGPGIEKSVARDSEMQLLDSGAKTTAANIVPAEML
jgi:hypothetical protein